ncbi:MAG: diguanylate cyclase domain-containing protein, partial [Acidimicrobiales bacterium]
MSDPAPAGTRPRVGRDEVFDAAAAGAVAVVGLLALALGVGVGDASTTRNLGNISQAIAPIVATWSCLRAARAAQGRSWRTGWILVAASCASWAVGQLIWTWFETIRGVITPFPSAADAFFLLAVPLAVAGMLYFPSSPGTQTGRARTLLDGLIVSTSVLWISWVTVLGPTLHDGVGTRLERAIGLAYPVGDAVLLTILIIAVVRCDPVGRVATGFVAVGFGSFAIADGLFVFTTLRGETVSEISNTAWVAGYLLVALGALHATRHPPVRAGELDHDLDRGRLALLMPYGPVALVLGISAIGATLQDPIIVGDVVFWLGAALITLLLIRQGVVILENLRLTRSLESTNEQLQYQVMHDVLTGLPNRPLFIDRLRVVLGRLQRVDEVVAVMFLDLDRFKPVNDTYGHDAGDLVLIATAERLSAAVRSGDTVARFGGDEFLVLCEDVGRLDAVLELADRIRTAVSEPVSLTAPSADVSVSVEVGLSIGMVLVDRSGIDAEALVIQADAAMYEAKRKGGGCTEVID